MPDFFHGAYGKVNAVATRESVNGKAALVVFGTAPVNQVAGGAANVNKPILIRSITEAQEYFGYSEDWASYTLCEAFHRFFNVAGVGPIVAVNVLDPAKHVNSEQQSKTLTPENGRIVIAAADEVIVDSVEVTGKTLNQDYYLHYDFAHAALQIIELERGKLGTGALTVKYKVTTPEEVDEDDLIGSSDGMGLNTGLYTIKNVYQETGYIPGYMLAPGWSSIKAVHDEMKLVSLKVNGHWDAWIFADLPLKDEEGTALNLITAAAWKTANGYNADNETVCFPLVELTDGKKYHLSVLRAVNHLRLLIENDGVPYYSASNTACEDIRNLYMGEDSKGRIYDDEIINKYLNANGITSATFMSGRWVIWGASAASYDVATGDAINVGETCRMMLYYISNDFQARRSLDVDKPMTVNDILTIVAQEQERLDALVSIGALTYAKCMINAKLMTKTDVMNGDWTFDFNVTNTPLAKSLTARVTWVDNGFVTYFDAVQAAG